MERTPQLQLFFAIAMRQFHTGAKQIAGSTGANPLQSEEQYQPRPIVWVMLRIYNIWRYRSHPGLSITRPR